MRHADSCTSVQTELAEEKRDDWRLVFTEEDDGIKSWQVREAVPQGISTRDFATSVVVEWRYAEEGPPTKEIRSQLSVFGEHLDPLELSLNSVLVHVIKGGGICEWCYYTRDYNRFMEHLNQLLADKPRFPIQIFHDRDPTWKYWRDIKECIEE
ncbi:MAG: DUF695 domain-containing protein [Azonexus sp.]|jgi:hypothetical protein|nr:DUF695 domain-containing protein [Azonexus sp.]